MLHGTLMLLLSVDPPVLQHNNETMRLYKWMHKTLAEWVWDNPTPAEAAAVAEQRQQAQQRRTQAAARAESRFVISLPAAALAQHHAAAPGALIHEVLSRAGLYCPRQTPRWSQTRASQAVAVAAGR